MKRIDGISLLCDALRDVGIDCVFGIPGTQNIALYEGFRRARIRTVLATHELAASFMANGYFRASGRMAALATIPGPGFTYALTGLAEARHDSAALLYLVGKPSTGPGRTFNLQALDQRSIAAPIVKASFCIEQPEDVPSVIRAAHTAALGGEPGPVLVELDMAALERESYGRTPDTVGAHEPGSPALGLLATRFALAQRPVFYAGQGALSCAGRLHALAETLHVPVLTTPSARGVIPEDRAVAMGFDPLRGNVAAANDLLQRADLIVGLGCKLTHNGTAGFQLRLAADRFVHVDADPHVVGATYDASLSVVATVDDALGCLEQRSARTAWTSEQLASARAAMRTVEARLPEPKYHGGAGTVTPAKFFAGLRASVPRDAIFVTDSGLHQILTRRHLEVLAPRGLICPSDFQSMGFGLPAALGARLAAPDRMVIALVGDGGFLMSGMEMLTAGREDIPVIVVVFNDGQLNQIRMQQLAEYGAPHAVGLSNPDYAVLAEAMGVGYGRFQDVYFSGERNMFPAKRPALLEVVVGDSLATHAIAPVARAREIARRTLGSRVRSWIKGVLNSLQR